MSGTIVPSDRSKPRSERGRRTRDTILAAAVSVFGREGVRQTSMLTIAQEAGVASGTVYQYFADKEDIFRALLGKLDDALRKVICESLDDDDRLRVRETVTQYLAAHRENVAIYRAWWDLLEPPTEFTNTWLSLHEALAEQAAQAARTSGADGRDPELAGQLVAMLLERQPFSRYIMGWDEEITDEESGEFVALLLERGLNAVTR